MEVVRSFVARLSASWRGQSGEQRLAGVAALLLLFTLFLPWYEKKFFVAMGGRVNNASDSVSGLGSADFVLASIVVVACAVLALTFFRGEKRGFHLPGGDGLVILVAAAWTGFLTFYRIVSPISVEGRGATVGVQWGVFVSFLASALLAFAGYRLLAAHRPEPPLPVTEDLPPTAATVIRPRRRPARPRPKPVGAEDERPFPGQLAFGEGEGEGDDETRPHA